MTYDAIIIGAGLSGLAAGIRLARSGKRVCILEAHAIAGGLNSYYRRGTREFDVGLHAMTNFAPKGARHTPLATVLKQLRIRYDDLELEEQWGSTIEFPSASLTFTNEFEHLRAEVKRVFPADADGFDALTAEIDAYDEGDPAAPRRSSRAALAAHLSDPLLVDMLLCPIMFYGAPNEEDIDWPIFVMLWKSLFPTGLCRPRHGMKPLVKLLQRTYEGLGGELRFGARIRELSIQNGAVRSVITSKDETLSAKQIYSSAGYVETLRLCSDQTNDVAADAIGPISIIEYIACLDAMPRDLGMENTIVFFSMKDPLAFRRPEALASFDTGVVCASNNYGDGTALDEGRVRVSHLANFGAWANVLGAETPSAADADGRQQYIDAKTGVETRCIAEASRYIAGFDQHIVYSDLFTPLTLKRYTEHAQGALYGSPVKHRDGRIGYDNLFLIGADQGYHGIVGSILSGISIANRHGIHA